jgi:hypothetical protein
MASKKQTFVRVSVFFKNTQAVPFELDPKTDNFKATPKTLVVTRGNGDVITIERDAVAYYVVGKFVKEIGEKHPAFPKEGDPDDGIDFA